MPEKVRCPYCNSDAVFFGKKRCFCDDCGETFEKPDISGNSSVKLFLSYSHKESDICEMIFSKLKARNYDIWFDKNNIKEGDDWREEITKGLLSSNGVIACMSRNSVRNPGVCLNELSIALGLKGGNIITILLEPEDQVEPPSSLVHRQWLDMSGWRKYHGEELEKWLDQRMTSLFSIIEKPENMEFSGQISMIRSRLPLISIDDSKFHRLIQKRFFGRRWLTEKIEEWLNDKNSEQICILYGDPGIGKSLFAAHYAHFNSKVIASVFCEYNRSVFNKASSVIQTLAYLIACKMPSYRQSLAEILSKGLPIGDMDSKTLFKSLLSVPLSEYNIDGNQENTCIVIDGLDECGDYQLNELALVISYCLDDFPKYIRILVTSRKVDLITRIFEGRKYLELSGGNDENIKDVKGYFCHVLKKQFEDGTLSPEFLDQLVERSEGIFLYASIVSEGILNGKLLPTELDSIPSGISSAFYSWFCWMFYDVQDYIENYRTAVGMIAFSEEPLPVADLANLWGHSMQEVNDLIRRFGVLLRIENNSDFGKSVELIHDYLKEWLASEQSGYYGCNKKTIIQNMAQKMLLRYQTGEELSLYEILYLFPYLKDADMKHEMSELTATSDFFLLVTSTGRHFRYSGNLKRTEQYYESAQMIADYLCEKDQSPDARLMKSICDLCFAEIFELEGKFNEAIQKLYHCFEIRKQLFHERCSLHDRKCFGVICERLAVFLSDNGEDKKAKDFCLTAISTNENLYRETNYKEALVNLGSNYIYLAKLCEESGCFDEEKEALVKALQLRKEQVCNDGNIVDQKDLMVAYCRCSEAYWRGGETEKSFECGKQGFEIGKAICNDNIRTDLIHSVAYAYYTNAKCLRRLGKYKQAEEMMLEEKRFHETLLAERGSEMDKYYIAVNYLTLSHLKIHSHEYDKAEEYVKKSYNILRAILEKNENLFYIRSMLYVYYYYVKILFEKTEYSQASEMLEKSFLFADKLNSQRGSYYDKEDLAAIYHLLSRLQFIEGKFEEGERNCDKVIQMREKQLRKNQTCSNYKVLGASLLVKCSFLLRRKAYDEAEKLYKKTLEYDIRNYHISNSIEDMVCVAVCYIQISDFCISCGNTEKSLQMLDNAENMLIQIRQIRDSNVERDVELQMAEVRKKIQAYKK